MSSSPLLAELIEALRCLPGVGGKSAQRMAFHLLERERERGLKLAGGAGAGDAAHRQLQPLPQFQRGSGVPAVRQQQPRPAGAVRGGVADRPGRDRAGDRLPRAVFRAAGAAVAAGWPGAARAGPAPAHRAPGRRRDRGADHRHQSHRGRRGHGALPGAAGPRRRRAADPAGPRRAAGRRTGIRRPRHAGARLRQPPICSD